MLITGGVTKMSNSLIIKKEINNLQENLQNIEDIDVEMCNLHSRIYSLKMSILAIDEQLNNSCKPTFSCLRESTFKKLVSLSNLRESYKTELENLVLLL